MRFIFTIVAFIFLFDNAKSLQKMSEIEIYNKLCEKAKIVREQADKFFDCFDENETDEDKIKLRRLEDRNFYIALKDFVDFYRLHDISNLSLYSTTHHMMGSSDSAYLACVEHYKNALEQDEDIQKSIQDLIEPIAFCKPTNF